MSATQWIATVLNVGVLMVGIVFLGLAIALPRLDFEQIKTLVDSVPADGQASHFDEAFFQAIARRALVLGAIFMLSAIAMLAYRQQLQHYVRSVLKSARPGIRRFRSWFIEGLRQDGPLQLAGLLIITGLALVTRLAFLNQPIRYDEAQTFLRWASKPLYFGLAMYPEPNNHLFHTLFVHLAYQLFGNHEWALRLPALWAGVLIVPAAYLVIRLFYRNSQAALLTAAFVASASVLVDYSTNARGYTMITLIFLLLLIVAYYLLKSGNRFLWFLFALISAAGFYTVPVMLYPFGIVVVWLLLSLWIEKNGVERRDAIIRLIVHVFIAAALTFILYTPVFLLYGLEAITSNKFVAPRSFAYLFEQLPGHLRSVFSLWHRDLPLILVILLPVGFAVSLFFSRRQTPHHLPLVAAVVAWILPLLLIQRIIPFERVWLFGVPIYLGLACVGFTLLLRPLFKYRLMATLSILVLTVVLNLEVMSSQGIYSSSETGLLRSAEAIVVALEPQLQPGDSVLAGLTSKGQIEYYFRRYGVSLEYVRNDPLLSKRVFVIVNHNYPTQMILEDFVASTEDYTSPELWFHADDGSIFELQRIETLSDS